MKTKMKILTNFIAILFLISVIPLFVLWLVFFSEEEIALIFLYIWLPLLIVGLSLFIFTFKTVKDYFASRQKLLSECIKIKAKNGKVLINTQRQDFIYKKSQIKLDDIVEVQLVNNQTVIDKSGVGESFVGGMLFGGSGAIAGAMVGKKQKIKDNYKIFIKTKNIKHAGIVISLKIDNAYNLFETLKLLTKK